MHHPSNWHQRASWGVALGVVVALAMLLTLRPGPFGGVAALLEYDTLDFWFSLRVERPLDHVAVVAIDEDTLRRWHGNVYNARDMALLLRLLKNSGATVVALSMPALADPEVHVAGDPLLARGFREGPPVCLPLQPRGALSALGAESLGAIASSPEEQQALGLARRFSAPLAGEPASANPALALSVPSATLLAQAAGLGHLQFIFDRYGRARRLALGVEWNHRLYPALAVAAASAAGYAAPLRGEMLLNYPYSAHPPGQLEVSPLPIVSLAGALRQPQFLAGLRGRAVVVGVTAPGMASRYPTPTGQLITLTELQAVALDNIISGEPLQRVPPEWHWLFTLLPAIITGGFAAARKPAWSGLVALLCVITVALASLGLFAQNLWLDTSVPWLTVALTFLVGVIGRARRQERESTHVASTIEALTQVSDIIAAQTMQWELLDRVLHWATEVLEAKGASALLLEPNGQSLVFAAALGPNSDRLLGLQVRMGEGIAGHVAQSGQPAIVNEARQDKRFAPRLDEGSGFSTRNILCVPLRVRDRTLGVIEVVNKQNGSPFVQGDADLLLAVANQSAVALENARLYERLNQRVEQSQGELAVANAQLQADKNLLQTVLHSMTDGVVVTDQTGAIQLVNPAATSLLPELDAQALGRPLSQVLDDFPLAALARDNAEWGQRREEGVVLMRGDRDAPRHLEARAAPLQSDDGALTGIVAVFADVTQRLQIESAKSDFVSFVAHEMRSPLTSISGFSAMLQRGEPGAAGATTALPAATRARFLALIHDESERLTRLINNLLDVARIEAGRGIELNRDVVDARQIALAAVESQRSYSSRHQIVCDFGPDLPPIYADADKVTQILINLISNALKYSPGGVVTVSVHDRGEMLELAVSDQGPGIAPEQQARLFERFGRVPTVAQGAGARAKPTGTGLGLFLTRHMVEAHGGRITTRSEPGQGATFCVTLPVVRG